MPVSGIFPKLKGTWKLKEVKMFVKLLGFAIILLTTTLIGHFAADKYSKRPDILRAIQIALEMLETHISFTVTILPDALEKIADTSVENVNKLFLNTADLLKLRSGMTAREAWNKSISELKNDLFLEKEDEEVLRALGNSLGTTDCENQLRILQLTRSKLSMIEKKAETLKQKNVRLCRSLGVLSGLLIIILLM